MIRLCSVRSIQSLSYTWQTLGRTDSTNSIANADKIPHYEQDVMSKTRSHFECQTDREMEYTFCFEVDTGEICTSQWFLSRGVETTLSSMCYSLSDTLHVGSAISIRHLNSDASRTDICHHTHTTS